MATQTLDKNTYPNTNRVLNEFAEYIIEHYRADLKSNRPGKTYNAIATGNLYNKVEQNVKLNGTVFTVSIDLMDYWQYVEDGRRAGARKPPYRAILKWISDKGITPYPDKRGKIPTEKTLAFIIQNSIAKKGIRPTNYLRYNIDDAIKIFKEKIEMALVQDFRTIIVSKIEVIFNKKT